MSRLLLATVAALAFATGCKVPSTWDNPARSELLMSESGVVYRCLVGEGVMRRCEEADPPAAHPKPYSYISSLARVCSGCCQWLPDGDCVRCCDEPDAGTRSWPRPTAAEKARSPWGDEYTGCWGRLGIPVPPGDRAERCDVTEQTMPVRP